MQLNFLKTVLKFRKRKRKSLSCVFVSWSCSDGKEMNKKSVMHVQKLLLNRLFEAAARVSKYGT